MKALLWLERHLAWIRWDLHFLDIDPPVIDQMYAQAGRVSPPVSKTRRTILLNIGTSVGGAIVIGVLSGWVASQRLSQSTADSINAHDARIAVLETKVVPRKEIEKMDASSKESITAINQRISDTKDQLSMMQSQLNALMMQPSRDRR